ncbi:pilin [Desulfogranum japonicum]|uniref:pilin n=1 Tax=Desulfogranum japonicum TaxID=231447 RepID=UPI0004228A70|nr:pilin [Desulfogranum japonicum]
MVPYNKKGFTLVELMIVISIISILTTMAMPSFQDRVIRSQVQEALRLADFVRVAVENFYTAHDGRLPHDNLAADLPAADRIVGNYTAAVAINDGMIAITLGNRINKNARGKVLALRPARVDGEPRVPIAWVCGYASVPDKMFVGGENATTLEPRLLPLECRY